MKRAKKYSSLHRQAGAISVEKVILVTLLLALSVFAIHSIGLFSSGDTQIATKALGGGTENTDYYTKEPETFQVLGSSDMGGLDTITNNNIYDFR